MSLTADRFLPGKVLYDWGTVGGLFLVLAVVIGSEAFRRVDNHGIPYKTGVSFINAWKFFTKRHSFLVKAMEQSGSIFSFNVLQHKVITVTGENARRIFYGDKDLNLPEGYKVLFGGAPMLDDIEVDTGVDIGDMSWFQKRITSVLRRERLAKIIPLMFQDLERNIKDWGSSGVMNPFDTVYNIVFQLTIRTAACKEIADSPEDVKRLTQDYWDMEKGSTPASVLFPWFPSAARKKKVAATNDLYLLIKKHLDARQEEGRREEDAVQVLIDEGDGVNDIVQFVMGVLFAGIINSGIMSSWIILYLHANLTWKDKALAEVRSFVAKYGEENQENVFEQLSQVPPEVWEDEMPVLDVCLRETIRMTLSGASLRRVMPKADTPVINGHQLQPGSFVAYPIADAHLNPDIYSDPHKWDPERYARGEDKKQHWAYVGWGTGRHPCLGMRFAKLEVKIILAMFLTQFEYDVVDELGNAMTRLSEPHRDNLYQVPPSKPAYVRFKRV